MKYHKRKQDLNAGNSHIAAPKSTGAKDYFGHFRSSQLSMLMVAFDRQSYDFLLVFYSKRRPRWNHFQVMSH